MDTGSKVLIVGGVLNIALSFLLGVGLARRRTASPIEASRFLLVAHEGAVLQGIMLLSLAFALALSDLSAGWETLAAWLLVVAATMQVTAALLNFRGGIADQFAEKSTGLRLNQVQAVLALAGLGIIVVGTLKGI